MGQKVGLALLLPSLAFVQNDPDLTPFSWALSEALTMAPEEKIR
jgi:hypothetical protein